MRQSLPTPLFSFLFRLRSRNAFVFDNVNVGLGAPPLTGQVGSRRSPILVALIYALSSYISSFIDDLPSRELFTLALHISSFLDTRLFILASRERQRSFEFYMILFDILATFLDYFFRA